MVIVEDTPRTSLHGVIGVMESNIKGGECREKTYHIYYNFLLYYSIGE